MYILGNALENLLRNKGRNLLLSAIILAIVGTTVIALSITNTSDGIIDDYRTRIGSRVIMTPDMDTIMERIRVQQAQAQAEGRGNITHDLRTPQVTVAQNLALIRSPYIRDFTMSARLAVGNMGLVAVHSDNELPSFWLDDDGNLVETERDPEAMPLHFRLAGGEDVWQSFEVGQRALWEGAMPNADGEVLISLEVAELNGLSVGDTMRIYAYINEGEGEPVAFDEMLMIYQDFIIVGIYLDTTSEEALPGGFSIRVMNPTPFNYPRNDILTTLNTVLSFTGGELEELVGLQMNVTYFLHNPSYLAAFEAEARSHGLDALMLVSTNEAEYYAIVAPVEGLRSVAQTFMWVVLILGGIVLVILSSIAVRERKYEIGVLRAMGMKKHKVAAGLWIEMLAITAICLVIGLGVGIAVSQPVSDTLLAAQLENLPPQQAPAQANFGNLPFGIFSPAPATDGETYVPIDTLDIALSARTVMEIIGIALLLSSLAALAAILKITKYEPIKILMERD